ncbi:ecdysone receptor B1-like isoform [Dinothrombium tinctorium]|uniref:Ecdysone receptor B1-like isoform n=1 Tax=Dinothrombium tinctorium TaxID=1965070 RepID=A0A3S3Q8X1_9ACAR|nr:ecdysone receptor B1-like isoform [Dinothrombium tinctorium]RWS16011.1 ecdysone receptor B1-like isoform [Dinothrombium tinctorium]
MRTENRQSVPSSLSKLDPLVLLWLSQTRAERVEEILDGSVSGSLATGESDPSNGVVIKKARAVFPDDFMNEESMKLGPCSVPRVKKEAAESSSRHASSSGSLQPIARKRAAYQAAAAAGNVVVGPTAESSPEVSSSQNGTGISPVPSLNSSELGEVDLDFWDLDINESSSASHSSGTSCCRSVPIYSLFIANNEHENGSFHACNCDANSAMQPNVHSSPPVTAAQLGELSPRFSASVARDVRGRRKVAVVGRQRNVELRIKQSHASDSKSVRSLSSDFKNIGVVFRFWALSKSAFFPSEQISVL